MTRYIDEISVEDKRVLMRVDFNVPLDDEANITDDNRIRAALPSICYAREHNARLILCSHMGRPKGERVDRYSLRPVAERLSSLLGEEVVLAPDCVGAEVKALVDNLLPGRVLLLENLRFHKEETQNDPEFASSLAELADVYINDAFAVSHRAHASVAGVCNYVKVCAAGFLMKKELTYFDQALGNPTRPLVAVIGGAKVSSKLGALKNLLARVNSLIIGGAMANTFLLAQGLETGASLVEPDLVKDALFIIEECKKRGVNLYLPVDCVVAQDIDPKAVTKVVPCQEIPSGWMALDIGPASATLFKEAIESAKTIVWNGPMGAFETELFATGTMSFAHALGSAHALTIIGGGDTGHAIQLAGQRDNVSYISTGGGAFLTLLEGKDLPGILALEHCGGN